MEFATAAIEAAKKAAETVKKISEVKGNVDFVTSDKDDSFSGALVKKTANSLESNISKYLDKKENGITPEKSSENSHVEDTTDVHVPENVLDNTFDQNENLANEHLSNDGVVNDYLDSKENASVNNEDWKNQKSDIDNSKINDVNNSQKNDNIQDNIDSNNKEELNDNLDSNNKEELNDNLDKQGLTHDEKATIKKEMGWSNEIIDAIGSYKEYEIYKEAKLKEVDIDGRKCLLRTDVNMDQKDEFGRTNRERMQKGMSPITENGENVELHHIGQKMDSPLAELTHDEHMSGGNNTILHDTQKDSEIDRAQFKKEREAHYKAEARMNT